MEYNADGWRVKQPKHQVIHPDPVGKEPRGWFPATKFFDQLSFIGDKLVGCLVLETSEGLIQFDCLCPTDYSIEILEEGYKELGLDINDLKAVIITHAHGDHYGKADYLREKYGAKIYMSKIDYDFINAPTSRHKLGFEIYDFLGDGDVFTLGDTSVYCYLTPGHSPGGLSFIFPVTDEGRPHMACMWGGTGAPRELDVCQTYLDSVDYFEAECQKYHVDVEVAAHPECDNGVERYALCRCIVNGVANPFVIGENAIHKYLDNLRDMVNEQIDDIKSGKVERRHI